MFPIILVVGLLASSSVDGYRLQSDSAALTELTGQDLSVCDICVDTLEEVKSLMTSQEIQKLINDVSDAFCKILPGSLSSKCEQMVDDVITESFQVLRDLLDNFPPKTVCQIVKLCPKSKEMDIFMDDAKQCDICEDVVASVRKVAIDPALEQMIKTNLEYPCKFFWPFQSVCEQRIEGVVVEIFARLRLLFDSYEDLEVCQLVQLCEAPLTTTLTKTSLCDVCVDTLEEGKSIIVSEEVEKLTADVTDFACALIPQAALAKKCKESIADMISEYFWMARDLLEKYPPRSICEAAKLCSKQTADFTSLVTVPKEQKATLCDICEDSVAVARTLLVDEKLEQAIATDMKFSCIFTGPFRNMCEKQIDEIVSLAFGKIRPILNNVDDHQICVTFQFCSDVNKTTVCDVCKDSYEEVKLLLVSEELENVIETGFKFSCRAFGPLRHICENVALGVVNEIFAVIHKEMDSVDGESFCKKFYMCSSKNVMYSEVKVGACDVCKNTINTIEDQLTNEQLENMIADLAKLSCSFCGPFKPQCESMIDEVAAKAFQLVRDAFDLYSAEEICKAAHIC